MKKSTQNVSYQCNECAVALARMIPAQDGAAPCVVTSESSEFEEPSTCCNGDDFRVNHPAIWTKVPDLPIAERDYSYLSGKYIDMQNPEGVRKPCVVAFCDYSVGITIAEVACDRTRMCLNGKLSVQKDNYRAFEDVYDSIFLATVAGIESGCVIDDLIEQAAGRPVDIAGSSIACATGL